MSICIEENRLNVSYERNFYNTEEADSYFCELYKLRFSECTLNIGGKSYTPQRKVCAFGDSGLSYKFSGTSIAAEEWTPLMMKLKEDVEAKVGTKFNYVMVNLYDNGLAKIGAHKDDERNLECDSAIVSLSFGAERNLVFQRKGFTSITLPIQHGSLYIMNPPTNKLWKHCIPAQPDVKEPMISLTFSKLKVISDNPPPKKRKLQTMNENIPENDWLEQHIRQEETSSMPITCFELSHDVILSVKEFNGDLRVDIRKYIRHKNQTMPTKEGVVMSPKTWYYFCEKIHAFNFVYKDSSFIANNCLLALNQGGLHLQHINCSPSGSLSLKSTFIQLNVFEASALCDKESDITDCIIERLWTYMLPRKFSYVNQALASPSFDADEVMKIFIERLETNIAFELKEVFHCIGCIVDSFSQLNHDCIYRSRDDKFRSLGRRAWLLLNVDAAIKDLSEIQSLSVNLFQTLTMEDYDRLLFANDKLQNSVYVP